MEFMETDSLEELWGCEDDYDDDEMSDGFFSRKEETKKQPDGGCAPTKKASTEKNFQQPAKSACPPSKQQRSVCPEKPSVGQPIEPKSACGPKKPKRDACVPKKKKEKREACVPKKKKKVKRAACGVVKKKRTSCKKKQKIPRSRNPFIIFFLKMLQKFGSKKHATEVAKEAGKKWCCMSDSQKKNYQKMACLERKRQAKKNQQQCKPKRKKC